MNTFVGLSGIIVSPDHLGIEIKSVQADVTDPSTNDVLITLTGSFGTAYEFSAVSPVVGEFTFEKDEDVYISSVGTSLNTVVINHVFYGSQNAFLRLDSSRPMNVPRPATGRWTSC